jgi:histidyl-tRNA synthetase
MKPSIPKGTRDFSPIETAKRNYIFDTIKAVFRLYGFLSKLKLRQWKTIYPDG